VRTNPIVGNLVHWFRPLQTRPAQWYVRFPDRRPRLEQVTIVLISRISGEEIANTKTWLLSGYQALKPGNRA
jgi:hypothetical protein